MSIFLRQLEYYSGIVFLTTNWPVTIDEAVKSRIHQLLRYASIDYTRDELRVAFDRRKFAGVRRAASKSGGRRRTRPRGPAGGAGRCRQVVLGDAGKTAEWAAASGRKELRPRSRKTKCG